MVVDALSENRLKFRKAHDHTPEKTNKIKRFGEFRRAQRGAPPRAHWRPMQDEDPTRDLIISAPAGLA